MSLKTDEQTQVRWQQLTEAYLKSQFDIKNKEKFVLKVHMLNVLGCVPVTHFLCVSLYRFSCLIKSSADVRKQEILERNID